MEWPERAETFAATLEAVAGAVAHIDDPAAPGLGTWDLAALANHTLRAVTTLQQYLLDSGETTPTIPDAAGYFEAYLRARAKDPQTMDRAVAARAEAASTATNLMALHAELAEAVAWARTELASKDPNRTITTRFGSLRLSEYVRTRSLELVVHGLDIVAATGGTLRLPEPAIADTLDVLGTVAIGSGRAEDVIRMLSGRDDRLTPILQ